MKRYLLYYAGFDRDTAEEQVGVAASTDLIAWEYIGDAPQIPLRSQGVADTVQTSNPCVLKHQGLYRMWYQGKSEAGMLSICYAESDDGLTWRPRKDVVLSPENAGPVGFRDGYQHPHVIFDEDFGLFRMWFVSYEKGLTAFMYAESVDGVSWGAVRKTNLASEEGRIKYFYPFVMKETGAYRAWFTQRIDGLWSISTASSDDGIAWTAAPGNPVIQPAFGRLSRLAFEAVAKLTGYCIERPIYGLGSPFVWKEDGQYLLIGHAVGPRGKLYIPLFRSADGTKWNKVRNNILPKPASRWNSFFQADPFMYVER